MEFLQDTHFLLSKHTIIHRLQKLLALTERSLVRQVQEAMSLPLPDGCQKAAGKVSRGENYLGLPYLVLDYPRLFQKQDIFVFRTMCWWGHFFSCTLHLQGSLLEQYRENIRQNLPIASLPPDTYLCVNDTPWEYHFGPDNYQLLESLSAENLNALLEKDFIKISRKIPLEQYQQLPSFANECLPQFFDILR